MQTPSSSRDTECYATEIEQLEPDGVMTNPYDQAVVFITAVLLFGNVMPKLWPARILLVEFIQFRNMTLGTPLLSITRNADEWLEYSNDKVTLLLSLTKNVFNGDTECYCGVRYFQSLHFIEPYRARRAIIPPNEKASCAA